ncbi:hypothetical protein H2201_008560 [Coniosporium apollinis]|uniref:Uncharacterized protein n=1 Tax=Coniosporium apollinis TaxID=61459 RepID=A0ABQ9NJ28_9PEZI|nr:hypothetical protein H2201_008560 [Coniosporium apollinis]
MAKSDLTEAFDALLAEHDEETSTLLVALAEVRVDSRQQEIPLRLQNEVLNCAVPAARQVLDNHIAESIERGMATVIPFGRAALPSPELGDIAFWARNPSPAGPFGGNHSAANSDPPLPTSSDTVASESSPESLLASTQPTATDAVTVEGLPKTNPMASSQSSLATTQSRSATDKGETGYSFGSNLEAFPQLSFSDSLPAFEFPEAGFGGDYSESDPEPQSPVLAPIVDTAPTSSFADHGTPGDSYANRELGSVNSSVFAYLSAESNLAGNTSQGMHAGEDLAGITSQDTSAGENVVNITSQSMSAGEDLASTQPTEMSAGSNLAGNTPQSTSTGEDIPFQGSTDTQITEQAPVERDLVIRGSTTPSKRRASPGSRPLESEAPSKKPRSATSTAQARFPNAGLEERFKAAEVELLITGTRASGERRPMAELQEENLDAAEYLLSSMEKVLKKDRQKRRSWPTSGFNRCGNVHICLRKGESQWKAQEGENAACSQCQNSCKACFVLTRDPEQCLTILVLPHAERFRLEQSWTSVEYWMRKPKESAG